MNIAHVAYTEHNMLMLDEVGVCVRVQPLNARSAAPAGDGALRCIGAQFVASIDPAEPGGLAHLPRIGTSMLFAAVDTSGKIFCVRAGPLTRFESTDAEDSGVHATPTRSEARSAPALSTPAPAEGRAVWDDATDPGFELEIELEEDDEDPFPDVETARYDPPRSSSAPPPRSGYGTRAPNPPPPPRVPRLRPSMPSIAAERPGGPLPQSGPRPTLASSPAAMRPSLPSTSGRGRPPSPSSHAWFFEPPAAVPWRR